MNKNKKLCDPIAAQADLTNTRADKALRAVIASVTTAVASGDRVTIPGFGTSSPVYAQRVPAATRRPARRWISPPARHPRSSRPRHPGTMSNG